jgi:heterodisulfide reductase subunit D
MIVYFAGCMASYREQNIAKTTIELLKRLNVDFTMLGKDEWCCGSVLLRTGNVESSKQIVEHNVNAIKALGADTVLTSCSGCFRTIKQDYPKFLGDQELGFKILHLPEFLKSYIDSGALKFKPQADNSILKVAYHDPCHIGRHMNIYDPPRDVLSAIPGIELVEMVRSKSNARCCGSGGGVSSGYKDLSNQMSDTRLNDAIEVNADLLTSACPFCTYSLKSAAERAQVSDRLKVMDLSELILQYLEE